MYVIRDDAPLFVNKTVFIDSSKMTWIRLLAYASININCCQPKCDISNALCWCFPGKFKRIKGGNLWWSGTLVCHCVLLTKEK